MYIFAQGVRCVKYILIVLMIVPLLFFLEGVGAMYKLT
jgi:hypothetical protein